MQLRCLRVTLLSHSGSADGIPSKGIGLVLASTIVRMKIELQLTQLDQGLSKS